MYRWPPSPRASWAILPTTWPNLAIELLAAAQGVDLRAPHLTSAKLQVAVTLIRKHVAHYEIDHYFAPDITSIAELVKAGEFAALSPLRFESQV